MAILIEGMEMPKVGYYLLVFPSGRVLEVFAETQTIGREAKAVPVPPHGRLIDADALGDSFEPSDFWNPEAVDNCSAAVRIVHSAPTIIPASEEEET